MGLVYGPNGEFRANDQELARFMERFKYPHPTPPRSYTPSVPWDIMIQQQQLIDKLEERCNSLEEKIDGLQSNKRSRAPPRGNLDTRKSIS